MILRIPLPPVLPARGFELEVRFRRIPPESVVLKALLNATEDQVRAQGTEVSQLYGRGEGSEASEQSVVYIRIGAEMVRERGAPGHNQLAIALEDIQGSPVDARGFVDIADTALRPL